MGHTLKEHKDYKNWSSGGSFGQSLNHNIAGEVLINQCLE